MRRLFVILEVTIMADEADIANDYMDLELNRALGKLRQTEKSVGSKACTACGDKMPPIRRNMGFKLCVSCAAENERRQSLFADY